MLHFLSTEEVGDIVGTMQIFEQIFSGSYLKGDKSIPNIPEDVVQLHQAALQGWGLLSTLIPSLDFCKYINNNTVIP